ncbi:MAG: chemotaxis response regulator protein-glutamate methylesterase [Proteobacteria bacterium]|nr:chemotaxis response regulator protein-glutamate methylesterase [Pseudomonadota bacterium]
MLVDDSAVIRGFFRCAMEAEPAIEVVSSVGNGQSAVEVLAKVKADVIVLDIEMPVMDGLTAIPKLLAIDPDVKIIMASTLTLANADISLKAMSIGATDYIPKPSTTAELHSAGTFKSDLIEKILALGRAKRKLPPEDQEVPGVAATKVAARAGAARSGPIVLRRPAILPATFLAIGSSTGGPQALLKVVAGLGQDFDLPVLITQHMPPTFTGILADHLSKVANREVKEASDGDVVRAGSIYVARGDYHMVAVKDGSNVVIRLNQDPPENFCRPAVDVMLRSLSKLYGNRLLTVILTGMGHDGLLGGREVVDAGGTLIAQDEATSVVWGMPGAVTNDGLCSAVVPLEKIAAKIRELSGRPVA